MWFDTDLGGKRFQGSFVETACCLLVNNLEHGGVVKHHIRQIVHRHIIIIIIIIRRHNITYSTNCKYRTAATVYAPETWFISGI